MRKYTCICGLRYFSAVGARACFRLHNKLEPKDTYADWINKVLAIQQQKEDMLEEVKEVDFSE